MANFQPTGQIKIGRVPFDNSYQHTMTFGSVEAQTSYMSSVCTQLLASGTYTYVRMNSAIRVPYNAEALYTYNYVMYQNSNYGNKWFYAFIIGCNYINENTTELVLELDVMQTWYFDYNLRQGFVEREHVNDDTIGAHLNPEPETPFNLVVKYEGMKNISEDMSIIVQSNAVPHFRSTLPPIGDTYPQGSDSLTGGIYAGVANGCKYLVFDKDTPQGDEYGFYGYMNYMNRAGAAEAITNVFMFPSQFIAGDVSGDWNILGDSSLPKQPENYYTQRPTSLDGGYVPRNNKLFTYPYCFCRIMDNNGSSADIRYELWEPDDTGYRIRLTAGIDPDAHAFAFPILYMGRVLNVAAGINFGITTKGSWTYSSYQTWSAQNQLANAISVGTDIAMMVPAARGIGTAAKALGVAAKSKGTLGALRNAPTREAIKDEVLGKHSKGSLIGGAIGAQQLGTFAGEVSRQSKIPSVSKGMATGNSLYASGLMWWSIQQVVIQEEFARILDDFFDMYGYQVDLVKTPNRTGRQNWNYVKMQNACHWGNVPADDMAQINAIYDAGITFWHTADVGNYSLPNGIV